MRKFRLIWFVFFRSTVRMEFVMALDNFNAAVVALNDAADRLIAKSSSDAAALTQAQSDLAAVDATATAAVQPVVDKLNAAAPQ